MEVFWGIIGIGSVFVLALNGCFGGHSTNTKKITQTNFGNVACRNFFSSAQSYPMTVCEFKTKSVRFCLINPTSTSQTSVDCKVYDDMVK